MLHCCGRKAGHLLKLIFLLCTISLLENTSVFPPAALRREEDSWTQRREVVVVVGSGLIKIELIPARSGGSHSEGGLSLDLQLNVWLQLSLTLLAVSLSLSPVHLKASCH